MTSQVAPQTSTTSGWREGLKVVKVWLDPKMAKEAVTEPLESKAEQEAEDTRHSTSPSG